MRLFLITAALSLFLFQCSTEEGPESFITVSVVPSQPTAINASIPVDEGGDTDTIYEPAVVAFSLKVKNDSDSEYHLALSAISIKYTNIVSGASISSSFSGGTYGIEFLASVAPGVTKVLVDSTGTDIIKFYTGGLPVDSSNVIRYRAEIEMIGWFTKTSKCAATCTDTELYTTQSKRLSKKVYFSTL
jgi:hypothetical protein